METRELLLPPASLDRAGYTGTGGYRALIGAAADPGRARTALLKCRLPGRGGAGFPFARKLALALDGAGPRVLVCNAAEDEPGSAKDRELFQHNPHVVIEGALIAAVALEAADVYLYLSAAVAEAAERAVAEVADDQRLCGGVRLHTLTASAEYVAGEASAAVSAINGGISKPLEQPPYPTDSGVAGRPTLVSNCETLANLPRILAAVNAGVPVPVTRLVTVTGDVERPGVYEVEPSATTFGDLIDLAGGVSGSGQLKAIQPGGPATAFLGADAAGIPLTDDAIAAAGSQPGCLAVLVLSTDRCIVEVVEQITGFFAAEQCGQCPPCRMKTQTYHRVIHQAATGNGNWDMLDKLAAVDAFVSDMPRRCALIDMPTPPVASARSLFRDDFASHIDYAMCPGSEAAARTLIERESAHG